MGLPKLNTVEYFETLPVSKVEAKYRPFNVKEQKVLLQAMEDGTGKSMTNGMISLIRSCAELQDDSWTIEKLSNTDLEWLFIKIRMKSVGETTTLLLGCVDENKTGCEGRTPVEIDFEKLEIQGEIKDPKIQLTDEVGVVLRLPSYKDVQSMLESEETISTDNLFGVINKCIDQIYDADSVYDTKEFTEKEINDFVDNLTLDQFNLIMDWFSSVPKMVYNVEFACEKCGVVQEQTLEGLTNFFG